MLATFSYQVGILKVTKTPIVSKVLPPLRWYSLIKDHLTFKTLDGITRQCSSVSPSASELHPPTQEKVSTSAAEHKNMETGLQ